MQHFKRRIITQITLP